MVVNIQNEYQTSKYMFDYYGNSAIFMVWSFKEDIVVNDDFRKICKLVINLNNSADARHHDSRIICVMGISRDAWIDPQLLYSPPRELENFLPIIGGHFFPYHIF